MNEILRLQTFMQTSKYIVFVLALLYIYCPLRHAKRYNYIRIDKILNEIEDIEVTKISNNLANVTDYDLEKCPYERLVKRNKDISISDIFRTQQFEKPNLGGEYIQKHCLPYQKSAIIVPYRNRKRHLHTFLNYMHFFLQQQNISYRIFIVEQNDDYSFNRAKLLNIGALEALNENYSCLIFSDVDLLPLNTGNIYTCSRLPRHMCSAIDIFRFNLPYEGLFGGVISIRSEQFKLVNGMSNEYIGWGGEDDDFYRRLKHHNITPYRFSPQVSRYTMLTHNKEKPSNNRFEKLEHATDRQQIDGLASLSYNHIVKLKSLYTHILVN